MESNYFHNSTEKTEVKWRLEETGSKKGFPKERIVYLVNVEKGYYWIIL